MLKKYKQLIIGIAIGATLFGIIPALAERQQIEAVVDDIKITLNGTTVDTQGTKPIVYNDRTYVPARYVAEALGAAVNWNETANTVELTSNDNKTLDSLSTDEWISIRDLSTKYGVEITASNTLDIKKGNINISIPIDNLRPFGEIKQIQTSYGQLSIIVNANSKTYLKITDLQKIGLILQ